MEKMNRTEKASMVVFWLIFIGTASVLYCYLMLISDMLELELSQFNRSVYMLSIFGVITLFIIFINIMQYIFIPLTDEEKKLQNKINIIKKKRINKMISEDEYLLRKRILKTEHKLNELNKKFKNQFTK